MRVEISGATKVDSHLSTALRSFPAPSNQPTQPVGKFLGDHKGETTGVDTAQNPPVTELNASTVKETVEATPGIEPGYRALQALA